MQMSRFLAPTGGVDEYHDPARLEPKRVQAAADVWVDGDDLVKRPGRRFWSTLFTGASWAFRGVREYTDAEGGTHLVVACGGALYDVTPSANTTLVGFNDDEPLHMHVQRGKLFVYGGHTQRKIVVTTASAVGLPKPTTAPDLAAGVAGVLTGSYAYKVTYVIETSGAREYESDPSPVSNSVTLASQQGSLGVPVSTDARVNARYIYRTTAGGARYYYVGKISDNTTTTYTDNLADASIGAEAEVTHGQPVQAEYGVACNERQLWLKDDTLRWSEASVTVAYLEYQKSTSFQKLPGHGKALGLASVYNILNNRDDAYVFQEHGISILPGGDPLTALRVLRRGIGGYHDTIAEYQGRLVFFSTQRTVCVIADGRVIDISTRSIPSSLGAVVNPEQAKGAVIFDHYYALTVQTDFERMYNNTTWVCDLDTITEVKSGVADARWYPWIVDVDYWIQRKDGTVLAFDNNSKRIVEYTKDEFCDEIPLGSELKTTQAFSGWVRTPDFALDNVLWLKKVFTLALHGRFYKDVTVTPYGMRGVALDAATISPVKAVFVAGQSKAGQPTSLPADMLEAAMPEEMAGVNMFSFKIAGNAIDPAFRLNGYQFSYMQFARGL